MTIKELKILAKTCRQVGILHYECGDVKFDLSPYDPVTERSTAKKIKAAEKSVEERMATMSEEDILMYSSTPFTGTEV